MTDKDFFKEPSAKEIGDLGTLRGFSSNLVRNVERLYEDQGGVIEIRLIPEAFDSGRKWMKHGEEVKLRRYRTLDDIAHVNPIELRREAFSKVGNRARGPYSFKPVVGDRKTRRVTLVECMEGAKIFSYVYQTPKIAGNPSFDIKAYDDAQGVARDGAVIVVEVPSRTEKHDKYKFNFMSVPILNNDAKYTIAHSLSTDHVCEHKRYQFRYKSPDDPERSDVIDYCAHDIAGYFATVDHFKENGNFVPLHMNQFAVVTQDAVDYYDRLGFNCLIKTPDDRSPRKLTGPEKTLMMFGYNHIRGHDKGFSGDIDGVKNYNWRSIV